MQLFNPEKLISLEVLLREIMAERQSLARPIEVPDNAEAFLAQTRAEIVRRRYRRDLLPDSQIFSDPAWDILLELFLADGTDTKLSVSAIGLDSGVPPSTVFRWIVVLEGCDLVRRVDDMADRRRHWIYLTKKGKSFMQAYFKKCRP